MKKQSDDITIKGLVDIFLPKLWIVAIVSIVFALIFGGYSMLFKKDSYTSTGKYMVSKVNYSNNDAQTGLNSSEILAMQAMIANAQEIIDTNNFANQVIVELETRFGRTAISASSIRKMMKVTLSNDETTCYFFSVTSGDPTLSWQVAEIAGELLIGEYGKTKYAIEITEIDDALVPTSPNSKNALRNAVIGFAGGLVVSLLVVFIASRFDIIIRTREKLEENFDVPILGVIPRLELND